MTFLSAGIVLILIAVLLEVFKVALGISSWLFESGVILIVVAGVLALIGKRHIG